MFALKVPTSAHSGSCPVPQRAAVVHSNAMVAQKMHYMSSGPLRPEETYESECRRKRKTLTLQIVNLVDSCLFLKQLIGES